MHELEKKVHSCRKCRREKTLSVIVKFSPVYSFGNPTGKDIVVVGQNPSAREYEEGFLSNRHCLLFGINYRDSLAEVFSSD